MGRIQTDFIGGVLCVLLKNVNGVSVYTEQESGKFVAYLNGKKVSRGKLPDLEKLIYESSKRVSCMIIPTHVTTLPRAFHVIGRNNRKWIAENRDAIDEETGVLLFDNQLFNEARAVRDAFVELQTDFTRQVKTFETQLAAIAARGERLSAEQFKAEGNQDAQDDTETNER